MPKHEVYEKCSICNGKRVIGPEVALRIDPPEALANLRPADGGGWHCFACDGEGYVPIGLTVNQVVRAVEAYRRELGAGPIEVIVPGKPPGPAVGSN
jgi:hypothetical protein